MTNAIPIETLLARLIDDFAACRALRAGSFIVTIYGNVTLPQGGSFWIGNVIQTCALVGMSETLARTAILRLVEAGQIVGMRGARRSFYRLTPQAAAEFEADAGELHGPGRADAEDTWTLVLLCGERRTAALEALMRRGFGTASGPDVKPGNGAATAFGALPAVAEAVIFRGPPETGARAWCASPPAPGISRHFPCVTPPSQSASRHSRRRAPQSTRQRLRKASPCGCYWSTTSPTSRCAALASCLRRRRGIGQAWRCAPFFCGLYDPAAEAFVGAAFVGLDDPLAPTRSPAAITWAVL